MRFRVAIVLAGYMLTACQPAGVTGTMGDGETISGFAVGFPTRTGVINLTSNRGTRCSGGFEYTSRTSGVGSVTCDDGRTANFDFISNGLSGTGTGRTSRGEPFNFGFGIGPLGDAPAPTTAPRRVE